MSSLRLLSLGVALTSLGCAHTAPAWVVGPVPLAHEGTVAIGAALPASAEAKPWTTVISPNGRDTLRLYRLQGSGAAGVGSIRATVSKANVVTSLYFEMDSSVPYKDLVKRLRKQYGEPSEECSQGTCTIWRKPQEYVSLVERADPKATRVSIRSGSDAGGVFGCFLASEWPRWPSQDYACQHGILELCPRQQLF